MEVKAEVPQLEYIAVSLKCEAEEPVPIAACAQLCAPVGDLAPGVKLEEADKEPLDREAGPGRAWQQEYLVGDCPGRGGTVCMVCGTFLGTCGPSAAREHVLQHHAHSLGLSPEEKHNILEAWSQGGNLPEGAPPPSGFLDSVPGEESGICGLEQGSWEPGPWFLLSPYPTLTAVSLPTGTTSPSEEAAPSSAPPEIRLFTDGSFPAGFTLRLYCRPQSGEGTVGKRVSPAATPISPRAELKTCLFLPPTSDPVVLSLLHGPSCIHGALQGKE
uniref:SPIN-DOC-like zinc-finger domain-containing protein n=1 Tax=Chelonoidis abingdonii TaxID=106734 RepID=A0A8C0IK82_CHEAB